MKHTRAQNWGRIFDIGSTIGVGSATLTMRFSGFTTNLVVSVCYRFQLVGTPGLTYSIQTAPQVTGPWTTIGSVVASPSGIIDYEDTFNRGPQAFYRAVSP